MAASLSVRVYTGTNAATQSGAVTGIDFISADNATNSLANRLANPLVLGGNSYEKWLKLRVDSAPANNVSNFKIWGPASYDSNITLAWIGERVTGVTPVATTSSIATSNFSSCVSGSKCTWDTTSYASGGNTTKYAVFQLQVGASAAQGNMTQVPIYYQYDET